jgi:transposase
MLKSIMSPKYLEVFNGYVSGLSQIEISNRVGMSRQMVNKTIMAIRDRGALIDKDYQTGSNSKIKRLGRMPK